MPATASAMPALTPDRERARHAFDAAGAAHELERLLLSLAESLRRGETPDATVAALIPGTRDRLNALVILSIADGDEVARMCRAHPAV